MSSEFRPLLAEDLRAVCNLIRDQEELFLLYPKGSFPLTVEQLGHMLDRRVEPTVLSISGRIAGFAAFYRLRRTKSIFIGNVVVAPGLRGQGLGKKLVKHMCELAFTKYDLPQVKISVFSQNTKALLLYASLGFKPYAIRAKRDLAGNPVALISLKLMRE